MGVHDNTESKYQMTNKVSPSKRPNTSPAIVTFGQGNNKLVKHEDNESPGTSSSTENFSVSLQQHRESLPVYQQRERSVD